MRLPNHLRRHHRTGIFHFRHAVPPDLRPSIGLSEITRSLHTRDSRAAQRLAYTLSSLVQDSFERLRNAMNGKTTPPFDPNNPATWNLAERQRDARDMVVRLPGGIELIADPNNPKDIKAVQETARLLVKDSGHANGSVAPSVSPAQVSPATLATPWIAFDPELQPCRLSQAVDEYCKAHVAKNAKTPGKYKLALNHFRDWLQTSTFADKDPFVHDIGPDHVAKWKIVLRAEAEARAETKRQRGHAQAVIADDPELAKVPLDVKLRTADNYLTGLSAFLKEMQVQHRYPRARTLPTLGQPFIKKRDRGRLAGWEPFSDEEMQKIFSAENFATLTKPHEYWFPLIALLTGARREEIAQLGINDIRIERGYWVIDINDRDFRRVKTEAGIRLVPLHKTLIDLGLLDYVKTVNAVAPKAKRLFPYLRFDKSNGFGDVPGEAFARYLDRLGITAPDKVMHSFRKNANMRLEKNEIDEPYRCKMIGHVYESTNTIVYTKGITLETLVKKVLPKLSFPEINFKALKRPDGFEEVLTQEIAAANKRRLVAQRRKARDAAKASGR